MAPGDLRRLAGIHGISREYVDNFGVRRRTSRDTMRALLRAMAVPCDTAADIRESLERHRESEQVRLLPPVSVAFIGEDCVLHLNLWWLRPELPSPMELEGELRRENGETLDWQPLASRLRLLWAEPDRPGYRLKVALPLPARLAGGYYDLKLRLKTGDLGIDAATLLAVSPGRAYVPPALAEGARLWGLNLPLYALRSRRNWGVGDFADLREATAWAASLGAAFVGVNPLHAPNPGTDADPSPYAPTSRLFLNFLYVNPEEVPELAEAPQTRELLARPEVQAHLARLRDAPLAACPEVRRLKRQVLAGLFAAFAARHGLPEAPRTPRGEEFSRFVAGSGANLKNFSLFIALCETQGKSDWRRWPASFHRPASPAMAAFAREQARELAFHQYVQWLAAGQRREVWEEARRAGLSFTLYQDLALGAAAGGFETWAYPDLFARGAAMGAPPDAFNPRGQNWGLPPLIPRRLAESGYRLFIDTLRANLPPGGILRLDHVMGLFRLFWLPEGAAAGAYVRYPARDLLGLLALESQRRQTLIIGEDLGTVAPRTRRELARARVFSYRVFYFERREGHRFKSPADYPRQALAAVTTHDLPTLAGYWEGRDQELKQRLDLYPSPRMAAEDAASREQDRAFMVEALVEQGLAPPNFAPPPRPCPGEVRQGVLAYLGRSRAALLEVRLEDLLGLTAQQNLPGTTREHPNWRQKLPAPLEDLRTDPQITRLAAVLNRERRA